MKRCWTQVERLREFCPDEDVAWFKMTRWGWVERHDGRALGIQRCTDNQRVCGRVRSGRGRSSADGHLASRGEYIDVFNARDLANPCQRGVIDVRVEGSGFFGPFVLRGLF